MAIPGSAQAPVYQGSGFTSNSSLISIFKFHSMADQSKNSKRSNNGRSAKKIKKAKRSDVDGTINLLKNLGAVSLSRFGQAPASKPIASAPADDDQTPKED